MTLRSRTIPLVIVVLAAITPPGWSADKPPGATDLAPLYRNGQHHTIIDLLADASALDYDQALYLGLSYLHVGDFAKARHAWMHAVRANPGGEGARRLARYATLLERTEVRRLARSFLQRNSAGSPGPLDATRIAVLPFRSPGLQTVDPLSKGLVEMVIADLSHVPSITVIDRDMVQALWDALRFEAADAGDLKAAARVGALLGAGTITTGSVVDWDPAGMLVDASVARTRDRALLASPGIAASAPTFGALEKALVAKVLCSIKQCPDRLDPATQAALRAVHTTSVPALRHWAQGLDHRDQERYRAAARSFVLAVQADPEFGLARQALMETPWFPVDVSTMIADAEALVAEEQRFWEAERIVAGVDPPEHRIPHLALPSIVQPPITFVPVNIRVQFP